MATVPSAPQAISGRVDRAGRLIDADPELEQWQRDAGSELGATLALPQVAAVAELARKLKIPVSRPALIGAADADVEVVVRAKPSGEDVLLLLENWKVRSPAPPRLSALVGGAADADARPAPEPLHWSIDQDLRVVSISGSLADYLGVDPDEVSGQALTRVVRLEEDEAGEMPMMAALAGRRSFSGQRASSRADAERQLTLRGDVAVEDDGSFSGFRGTAALGADVASEPENDSAAFDEALDEALRSPLDRIIESAERIVGRADGPLRNNYASYGADIAAAARHLLAVVESMREGAAQGQAIVNLAALAGEAVVLLESTAAEHGISFSVEGESSLPAKGEERGIIQILVNLVGNALRHSPEGSTIQIRFTRTPGTASVTIADQGPGIDAADQQRIFERFERADDSVGGTGLGLAIARRLARSMGGDVTLESAPGQGARFTLTLPRG